MTQWHQQPSINDEPNPATFEGFLRANTAIPAAALTALPLTIEVTTDPLISHPVNSSDLTFLAAGRVVASWQVTIGNTNNFRTQSATSLFINAGAGFLPISGTFAFGYHRTIAEGNGTITAIHQFQTAQRDTMRIASIRIAGLGVLQFIGGSCTVRVELYPDI